MTSTTTVDLRPLQTPVVCQGHRATCSALAVTAAHEWMAGDLPRLSAEFAHWAAKRTDRWPDWEATSVAAVLDALSVTGQPADELWPYGDPPWPAPPPAAARREEGRRRLGTWADADPSFSSVVSTIERGAAAILTLGLVPQTWRHAAADGRINHDPSLPAVTGHAVLAVGLAVIDGSPSVIVKNSWGVNWGDEGYGYVADAYADTHLRRIHRLEAA